MSLFACAAVAGLIAFLNTHAINAYTGKGETALWVDAGFFWAVSVYLAPRLVWRDAIKLDPQGFQAVHWFYGRPRRIAWAEVSAVRVGQSRSSRFVICRLKSRRPFTRAVGRGDQGAREIWLPNGLELGPDQILSSMEAWLKRYGCLESE